MRRRFGYLITFFVVLAIEICIGLFVRDSFVRPYVGDILVTVLLCCLCRAAFPQFAPAAAVFLFAAAVECLQWFDLAEKLGLQGTVPGIILGTTFDWKDILCYAVGCVIFAITEWLMKRTKQY